MVDSEMIPFNHQIGQTGLDNPSEDLYLLWCIRSNSADRRNQGYKFMCCSSTQTKMLRFLELQITESRQI